MSVGCMVGLFFRTFHTYERIASEGVQQYERTRYSTNQFLFQNLCRKCFVFGFELVKKL